MDVLSPNVWILGLMCLLGTVTSVYCIVVGNRIYQTRRADTGGEDEATDGASSKPAQPSADNVDELKGELRDARGTIRRLEEVVQKRALEEERRRRFALRLARVVIDEFEDDEALLTEDVSTNRATKERIAEKRRPEEQDVKGAPVGKAPAESQSASK